MAVGQYVLATNVQPGTFITAIDSTNKIITLSKPTTGTVTVSSTPKFLEASIGMYLTTTNYGFTRNNPFTDQYLTEIKNDGTNFILVFDKPILSANASQSATFQHPIIATLTTGTASVASSAISLEYGAHLINGLTVVVTGTIDASFLYSSKNTGG